MLTVKATFAPLYTYSRDKNKPGKAFHLPELTHYPIAKPKFGPVLHTGSSN
jgi:hypothetical protein